MFAVVAAGGGDGGRRGQGAGGGGGEDHGRAGEGQRAHHRRAPASGASSVQFCRRCNLLIRSFGAVAIRLKYEWPRGSPGTPAAHRGDTDHPPARAGVVLPRGAGAGLDAARVEGGTRGGQREAVARHQRGGRKRGVRSAALRQHARRAAAAALLGRRPGGGGGPDGPRRGGDGRGHAGQVSGRGPPAGGVRQLAGGRVVFMQGL
eukprot:1180454-Prorocentrum_minimum.AAC.3